ncbi:MAG: phosphatidate cytidylyltransferase [Bacteroidetes bacterium]|nr:phosphatidate cytidylyltransferase [Bacteroidota bacterium]
MAINKQTLKTRALTALVFVLVMFAGLFINQYTFITLFTVIMFGCLYEFSKIVKLIHGNKYLLYLPIAFVYIILPLMLMIDLGVNGSVYLQQIAPSIQPGYSALLPCAIIFSLWVNDTMAYLVGSMIGKTPFSKISPKKTWEGTLGGVVLCIISMALLGHNSESGKILSYTNWIVIATLCAFFGTIGDLLESKIKRMANIKDSGMIMPGHGGFLDRFDSLLIATPIVWLYIRFLL